jgi:hypothetical protein
MLTATSRRKKTQPMKREKPQSSIAVSFPFPSLSVSHPLPLEYR